LNDVEIQTFLVPGTWHDRHPAREVEPGVYAIDFVPPEAGVYYISIASAAIGLEHNNPHLLILKAASEDKAASTGATDGAVPATNDGGNQDTATGKLIE
ncbi:MAG: hypothetical protein ABI614_09040, partial [Planctomycetota bacterium]